MRVLAFASAIIQAFVLSSCFQRFSMLFLLSVLIISLTFHSQLLMTIHETLSLKRRPKVWAHMVIHHNILCLRYSCSTFWYFPVILISVYVNTIIGLLITNSIPWAKAEVSPTLYVFPFLLPVYLRIWAHMSFTDIHFLIPSFCLLSYLYPHVMLYLLLPIYTLSHAHSHMFYYFVNAHASSSSTTLLPFPFPVYTLSYAYYSPHAFPFSLLSILLLMLITHALPMLLLLPSGARD